MSSRSSSPSSSRSSATPPPQIIPEKKKKKSTATSGKDKKKEKASAADGAKNEGENLNWAYTPPAGAVLVGKEDIEAGDFDWDRINNDENLELWLIRVPESVSDIYRTIHFTCIPGLFICYIVLLQVKPKYLENIKIDVPSSSKSALVGTVKRKHTSYDIWSVGADSEDTPVIGGEEIKNLTCLLPRTSKKGKLYPGE